MQANVEIIENPKESVDRAYDISISAREELLLAFPTANSFLRKDLILSNLKGLDEETLKNTACARDEFGITHDNILYNREEDRFYCLLDAPSKYIVMISTPNAPDGLFERIEKEAEETCIYKRCYQSRQI